VKHGLRLRGLVNLESYSLNVLPKQIEARAVRGPKLAIKVGESVKDIIRDFRLRSPNAQAETVKAFTSDGRDETTDAIMAVGGASEFWGKNSRFVFQRVMNDNKRGRPHTSSVPENLSDRRPRNVHGSVLVGTTRGSKKDKWATGVDLLTCLVKSDDKWASLNIDMGFCVVATF
jgi:hypothetical protein